MSTFTWTFNDNLYVVHTYVKYLVYYYFDFYPVYEEKENKYTLKNYGLDKWKFNLEEFDGCYKGGSRYPRDLSPEFGFFFRIDEYDGRFYAEEIMFEEGETTFIIQEAFIFAKTKFKEIYA